MAEMNLRLRQAIAAARAGKTPQAKLLAESALEENPEDVNALLLLSALAESEERQVNYLEQILAKDPDHAIASRRLAQLGRAPAADTVAPADTLETADAESATTAPEPTELAVEPRGPADEPETEPGAEVVESTTEAAGVVPAEDMDESPVEDYAGFDAPGIEAAETVFEKASEPLFEAAEPAEEPFLEQEEASMPDEIVESPFEESPAFETESTEEPVFEEVESPMSVEFEEPMAASSSAFEPEELPDAFARKLETLLPEEMAAELADALEAPPVEESQEPPLANNEPLAFEETIQPRLETAPEETAEPDFDDAFAFPVMEEQDFPVDDPEATLLDEAPELPDLPAQEQLLSELHDFPVEDLRKPAAMAADEGPTDLYSEAPEAAESDLYEPAPVEIDDLDAGETAPPEEQSPERPQMAVTAPLSHDVIESPPDAREGLAAQLDEELFEEETGQDFESLIDSTSQEAGQALAASAAGLEAQREDEIGSEDMFGSLVEDTAGSSGTEDDHVTGFEPGAESDIPDWLREAEDSSLTAAEEEFSGAYQEPAELNDIPAWLLDDNQEEWSDSESEAKSVPTSSSVESMDVEAAQDVAVKTAVAAPTMVADYSDDEIDAAMATIIDDKADVDTRVTGSAAEETAEIHPVDPTVATEEEKSSGPVSTRALEIALVVLVVIAVIVLVALALVVLNPFS
jgi:hypothetical protein